MANQTVSVSARSVATWNGTIVEVTDTHVTLQHRKPRSSKQIERTIPASQIVAVYGNVGEEGQVIYQEVQELYSATGEVSVSGNQITVTPEDDAPTVFYAGPGLDIDIAGELAE